MDFLAFLVRGVWAKKARSLGLILAITFAVLVVVTLDVSSNSLKKSAAAVISVGKANITVAQKGGSNVPSSGIDDNEVARLRWVPGVTSAVGVLVETERINTSNPSFLEFGIAPQDLTAFGVTVVARHPSTADATNQVMLGWRPAANLNLHVGSRFYAQHTWNTVTMGIFSTSNALGDADAMFALPSVQTCNRLPGVVTLVFVTVADGNSPAAVASMAHRIEYSLPELATITTASQFARADQDLVYLQAAVTASSVLAIIGAVIVGNTMLLSLFERTKEFGVLRAAGWTRRPLIGLLLAEDLILGLLGAAAGVGLSYAMMVLLEHAPDLTSVLHADFTSGAVARGLASAFGMTILGSLCPAIRAALSVPLKALSHE